MKILLDTHIILWYVTGDSRLPERVIKDINDGSNEVYYSIVSLWEVAIKHQISAQRMPVSDADFSQYAEASGMACLMLAKEHIAALKTLRRLKGTGEHHDPFDRMLISQAKVENALFVSHDGLLRGYDESCVLIV